LARTGEAVLAFLVENTARNRRHARHSADAPDAYQDRPRAAAAATWRSTHAFIPASVAALKQWPERR
jgi:hypothetical protein